MNGLNKTFSILLISILMFSVPVSAGFDGLRSITGYFDFWECLWFGTNCGEDPVCGDAICDGSENPNSCPEDCRAVVTEESCSGDGHGCDGTHSRCYNSVCTPCNTNQITCNGDNLFFHYSNCNGQEVACQEGTVCQPNGNEASCVTTTVSGPDPCDADACSSTSCSGYDACTCAGQCGNNINCNWGSPSEGSCGGAACEQQGSKSITKTCGPSNCNTAAECSYPGEQAVTSQDCTMPVCIGGSSVCNNGAIEAGETCDGTNFGSNTCSSQGKIGTPTCHPTTCQVSYSSCTSAPTTCVCNPNEVAIRKCDLSDFQIYKRQDNSIVASGRVEAEIESCCGVRFVVYGIGGRFSSYGGYQEKQASATAPHKWTGRIESTISGPVDPGTYGSEVYCKTGADGPGAFVGKGNDYTVRERIE